MTLLTETHLSFISIKVREDNLMYIFFDESIGFSVDPFVPSAIIHALGCDFEKQNYTAEEIYKIKRTKNRKLIYSLTTHSHYDHAGGNEELKILCPSVEFIDYSNIKNFVLNKFEVFCIKTPCHTLDSMCFYVKDNTTNGEGCIKKNYSYVLTGDFIFKLGCGRFFEGNSKMFIESVDNLVRSIDKETILLYGHDYYHTNKRFVEQFYPIKGCDDFFLNLDTEITNNPFMNPDRIVEISGTREEKIKSLRKMKDMFI